MVAKKTNATSTKAKEDANELLKTAFKELKETVLDSRGEDPRLFFPNGIELISITLNVVKYVEIEFKIAGAAGIKALLESKEAGVDPTAIIDIKKEG